MAKKQAKTPASSSHKKAYQKPYKKTYKKTCEKTYEKTHKKTYDGNWKGSSDFDWKCKSIINPDKVIGFYKAGGPDEKFPSFSNFYRCHRWTGPYKFVFPKCVNQRHPFPDSFTVYNSEQALMCTKAAMAGDYETFQEMLKTDDPGTAKWLQERIKSKSWRGLYKQNLDEIAFQVVLQKFASSSELKKELLSTGRDILAEATANDSLWGIGINKGDQRVQDPKKWKGWNVLGMALMKVRAHFRDEDPRKVEEAMEALWGGSRSW